MPLMMSTKITKGGQTTVPKEIRVRLGISEGSRVFWSADGTRVTLSAAPILPNEVSSEDEFWQGVEVAMREVESGRVRNALSPSDSLRTRHGL